MAEATLIISSKNYSSWSLRGWLLTKMAGLDFDEEVISPDDPSMRAELLLLSPSYLVPCLIHGGVRIWDTLAIAEYLNEIKPEAGLLPKDQAARARCRSICGEMHSGFSAMRSAMPMNLRGRHPGYSPHSGARADIERITTIWRECLAQSKGPWLFGSQQTMADALYAPVATRFVTWDIATEGVCAQYCRRLLEWPAMIEWTRAAIEEPDQIEEFEAEF
jgi:glutathione S-transferase